MRDAYLPPTRIASHYVMPRRRWLREYGGAYIDDITAVVARLDCTDIVNDASM